ncbi:hypothetical protein QR680_000674 [Steinernema hermaphroditum]|uniref:4Fe-4S ferredoxin-type domain-containing protein n=1 Tax=Steinernema hermaphroditum TaxID=289476 RepID=A0AA39GXF0_9BILA|nr:hypothetical protein QR680_000674 [Steinernema hermaphroditum]
MQVNLYTSLTILAVCCVLGESAIPVMGEALKTNQLLVVGVSGCRITFETPFSKWTCGMNLDGNTTISKSVCNWTSIVPLTEPYGSSTAPMKLPFFGYVDNKQVMSTKKVAEANNASRASSPCSCSCSTNAHAALEVVLTVVGITSRNAVEFATIMTVTIEAHVIVLTSGTVATTIDMIVIFISGIALVLNLHPVVAIVDSRSRKTPLVRHLVHRLPAGQERCFACKLCEPICPAQVFVERSQCWKRCFGQGPFWISVALIVTTGILGNLSKYIKSSGAADQTLLSVTTMCIRIQSYNNCSSFDSFVFISGAVIVKRIWPPIKSDSSRLVAFGTILDLYCFCARFFQSDSRRITLMTFISHQMVLLRSLRFRHHHIPSAGLPAAVVNNTHLKEENKRESPVAEAQSVSFDAWLT